MKAIHSLPAALLILTGLVGGCASSDATRPCPPRTPPAAFCVDSRKPCNSTGIWLRKGRVYKVVARKPLKLVDGIWPWRKEMTDLNGWDERALAPFSFLKRHPADPYFALIGTVGGKSFRIREATPFPAPADGELRCYLNDSRLMYWNNCGVAPLCIVEVGREAGERRGSGEGE